MRQELSVTIGSSIAHHRKALGMTQEQLSLALDVDPTTISRFERGVSLPSLTTIQKVCSIFGISLSHFFDETAPQPAGNQSESAALVAMLDQLDQNDRQFIIGTIKRFCQLNSRKRR